MEQESIKRGKFRGVAAKVIMLAIFPALIMAIMNFYSTNQMTELAHASSSALKRFSAMNNTIILSSNQLKDTMFILLDNMKILTRQHQSGIMRHDSSEAWNSVSTRNRVLQSIDDFSNAIKTLDSRLTKIREQAIGNNISAQAFNTNIRFINFLVRSEVILRNLFDQFIIINDQTLLYMESGSFDKAVDSYIYEEGPMLNIMEVILSKMSKILSDMVSDINQVQSLIQENRNVEINETMSELLSFNYSLIAFVTLILISLTILYAQFQLASPLQEIVHVMAKLSLGDTKVDIPKESNDEVGDISRALKVFRQNAIDKAKLEKEKVEQQERLEAEKKKALRTIALSFEENVKHVVGVVTGTCTKLGSTAELLASNANDSRGQASSLKDITVEANDNVQAVAEAIEGLNQSIQQISENVIRSADITSRAKQHADESNETVRSLIKATKKIDNVVQFINEINSQINLLALNASIEAARAGEAGKGFSVVASEVQLLANQTVQATESITSEILAIQDVTQETAVKIEKVSNIITEINEISSSVASTVSEQASTTAEISTNVAGAARGTFQLSDNALLVSNSATKTGTFANDTLTSVQELLKQSTNLRHVVDEFFNKLQIQS